MAIVKINHQSGLVGPSIPKQSMRLYLIHYSHLVAANGTATRVSGTYFQSMQS